MKMAPARLFREPDAPGIAWPTASDSRHAALGELAEQCAEPNPFYHPALLLPALDHLDLGHGARLLTAEQGGMLIAAMPVMSAPRHGRLPIANVVNWVHPHCFFGAPLLCSGREEEGWQALLTQLDAAPWAGQLLHLTAQDEDGPVLAALQRLCARTGRGIDRVGHYERALLASPLSAQDYWEAQMRPKKRKEIRRLINRLDEMGTVVHRRLADPAELPDWTEDFLRIEASGWKGANGSAIASHPATDAYFRAALAGAQQAGMLDMLRIDCDGHAIAMLVNFRHGRGGFSYKIAIDENFGRFSPGVLIEIDNLYRTQDDDALDWMDSCAAPDHPMIDGLWAQRRRIGQYRVALHGRGFARLSRATSFTLAGSVERARRGLRRKA
ncbi:GNAT family N-acetyltransferase [Sphingobium subterraneum]|uniref:CelD/BcsL family acetyltransferase involved in cellulose biosynthesis n=1 Tax=Sphingobium subterraneum TaxID=627688 RepID=A0A841J3U6_9SPHN|nr:GNAT family N-acetyltransferase [Sphingobium subterraneum]MBB6124186.1 CelD/BcsL family acetyltransferase involved in cellulose biosynthesis [Sphingobium subterraneum]